MLASPASSSDRVSFSTSGHHDEFSPQLPGADRLQRDGSTTDVRSSKRAARAQVEGETTTKSQRGTRYIFAIPTPAVARVVLSSEMRLAMQDKPLSVVITPNPKTFKKDLLDVAGTQKRQYDELLELVETLPELEAALTEPDLDLSDRQELEKLCAHAHSQGAATTDKQFITNARNAIDKVTKINIQSARNHLASIPREAQLQIPGHGCTGAQGVYTGDTESWPLQKVAETLHRSGKGLPLDHRRFSMTQCNSADRNGPGKSTIEFMADELAKLGYSQASVKGYAGLGVSWARPDHIARTREMPGGQFVPASEVAESVAVSSVQDR